MTETIYVQRYIIQEIDEIPAGQEQEKMEIEGQEIPLLRYGPSQQVSPTEWDYYELGVAAATRIRPDDLGITVIGGTGYQEWVEIEVPDGFVIPDNLDPGDTDPDPEDPLPQPYQDFYSRYTTFGPTLYDQFGYPVPRDGAWQRLEDVGNPMVDRVLKIGVYRELAGSTTGELREHLEDIKVQALDGNSPLEQAIRAMHRASYDVLPALGQAGNVANFGNGPGGAGSVGFARQFDQTWWAAQRVVSAAFNNLVASNAVPELSAAPSGEREMIRQALVAYSVGLGGDFMDDDESVDVIYGNSGKLPIGNMPFGGFWSIATTIVGSILDDRIWLSSTGVAYLGPGDDRGIGDIDDDDFYGGSGKDMITGDRGSDLIFGDAGDDDLRGDRGNDQVRGGPGNDVIRGGTGAGGGFERFYFDFLFGDAGADRIFGEGGKDIIEGGADADVLNGGQGPDIFRFRLASDSLLGARRDVITDFSLSANDIVELRYIDAKAGPGNQKFSFIGSAAFSAAGQVRAVDLGNDALILINIDHARSGPEMSILLKGVDAASLTRFDFDL